MINIRDFINGSEYELELVIKRFTVPLMKYCYSILCNYSDAEDAVQMTFIKIYDRRKTLKKDEAFSSFLYRTAYTTCIDIIRKRKFLMIPFKEEQEDRLNYMSEELENALKKLSLLDRALIYGRVIEEYSYEQLSIIHGKSEASLRKRYQRAKEKLAKNLENDEYNYYIYSNKEESI
ncbi:RNA polymerase sigma factor [Proteiniborus sp. MB09-C3]|uniref:RNA polymerase sigma factor n=1 Tax=Proteiniborus sp. MB09-C3 TaxID=3050072 RepID=UPI002554F27E|nr:RNA polymerase sigma factor [Proteiniborus sp. MB09-C3]WIV13796.1 RNA polymerase sigma factor [Proteiniborus sp. MB09-C3]